jgi:hypothetical protein
MSVRYLALALVETEAPAVLKKKRARRALLRHPWAWLALAAAIFLIARCLLATFAGFDRDEGAFFTIAQEILHGRLPYRDVFDHKGPGVYYLLAGSLALTSHFSIMTQVLAARTLAVLADILTAVGLVMLGQRWWRLGVGITAALLWLYAVPLYQGSYFLTEPFATALTVWAVVVLTRWPGLRSAVSAGLLIALASFFKQTAILALPGLLIIVLSQARSGQGWSRLTRQQVASLGALAAGAALPWMVVMGLFAIAGGFLPLYSQVVIANLSYPSDPPAQIQQELTLALQEMPLLALVPLEVLGVGLWRWVVRRQAPGPGAVVSVVIGGLNLVPFIAHAYLHYWLTVAPWMALLTALGLLTFFDWVRPLCMPLFAKTFRPPRAFARQRQSSLGKLLLLLVLVVGLLASSLQLFRSAYPAYEGLKEQIAAGAWIAQYTPPGARLLVAPAEPKFYYLSGSLPVTSYIYLLPVNLSPALVGQVINALHAHQFDRAIWYTYGASPEAAYTTIYQQLTASYHIVAMETLSAANGGANVTIYAPDGSGG